MSTSITNKVYVLESPEFTDGKKVLAFLASETDIQSEYFQINTRDDFFDALDKIHQEVKGSVSPMIHISSHGNSSCLAFADNVEIKWEEVRDKLLPINQDSHNNVVFTLSICKATYLASIDPTDRSPFWGLVGCNDIVYDIPSGYAFVNFYKALFEGRTLNEALGQLNQTYEDELKKYQDLVDKYVYYEVITTEEILDKYLENIRINRSEEMSTQVKKTSFLNEIMDKSTVGAIVDEGMKTNVDLAMASAKEKFLMLDLFPLERKRYK